jgi:hypothetical protein
MWQSRIHLASCGGVVEQCDISISSGSNVMGWQPSLDTWRIAMKLVSLLLVLFAGVHSSSAQSNSAVLMPGLGQHHHTISTKNSEAQRFFDQGLTLVFAFNHEEAARAFRWAA